jgi:CheY-like chemotaxis protein
MSFLLVDDDFIFRTIAVRQIELFGVTQQVLQADNGQKAVELLSNLESKELPEAILLDLNMPIMNGWDFLENIANSSLKAKLKTVPIWIVTSSINPEDIEKSKTFSMVRGFLNKPLKEEDLTRIKKSAHNSI